MLGFALKQSKNLQESKLIERYVAILKLIFAQSYFYIVFCALNQNLLSLWAWNQKWNIL